MANKKIEIKGSKVRILKIENEDYICITDIAKTREGNHTDIIKLYLRNRNNLEFLGLWEEMYNPEFDADNFQKMISDSGRNSFIPSVKDWIKKTNAKGIESKAGRYGGTYAHKDIAVHFATWLSPATYLYLIKEFQRLKEEEFNRQNLEWHIKKITDNIDNVRNLLDTIPGQDEIRKRIK